MDLYKLSLSEIAKKIKSKEVSIKDVLDSVYSRIEDVESKINAYVTLTKENAYKRAEILQIKLDAGEDIGVLGGVPIAIKDNICIKDVKTTCSSRMLQNFVPPYTATVVEKLENMGAIVLGKTNMDEFAMGSSTESSYIKKTCNPWDLSRVPGGSSGGSAASVSADMAYASLGSDTGGSIRQPASLCSVVGLKPTYGVVSRYGLVAFASSLDQIGPFSKTVEDAAIMLNAISGHDTMDSTSADIEYPDYTKSLVNDVNGFKIGIPTKFISEGLNPDVKKAYEESIELLKNKGAQIVEIDLDYAKYSLAVYYILATAEASSNLGRYDGIKYGYRTKDFDDLTDLYKKSRTEGFGAEVKRRIILGTYVLSSGYYDAYYKKAQQVRTLIINDFKKAYEKVDVIMVPTAPNTAFKFGEKTENPIEMYLEDIFTVPVNIAGLPGISIPCGFDSKNMPIGLQFIADAFEESKLLRVAYTYEQNTGFHKIKPEIK
ncbi:MAG: Asp-tRNA(Asn)/Glu-tRNA(Gln) amidotransferase subunit GatA [Clostridia bacterium]|nr:Asp-tRNA(Asn)/Glu-tRNA(Gln) amidotransferase subunit GatA [Clostridia bacterium]